MNVAAEAGPKPDAVKALENKQLSHAKKGVLFALGSGLGWATGGTFLSMAASRAPFDVPQEAVGLVIASALALAFLHDALATVWVFLINCGSGRRLEYWRTIRTKPGLIVCCGALMGGPVGMSGYLLGISMLDSAYALPITATYPAVATVLAYFILKEKIGPRSWLGIGLCICGSIIIGYSSPEGGLPPNFALGFIFCSLATIGWGCESVLSTFGMDMVDPDVALGIRELFSALVFALIILPGAGLVTYFGVIPGWGLALEAVGTPAFWLCAVAGFFGGASYIIWYRAMNMTGVARALALNITFAVWGVLFGWLFTDQQITVNVAVGAGVICFGAILVSARLKDLFSLRNN